MADDKKECIICDKKITPNNSPSEYDQHAGGVFTPKADRYAPICDKCADKFGDKKK